MSKLLNHAETAWLMVGPDLRASGSSAEWRRLNLPGGITQTRERIDDLFPSSDVRGYVLDVLASGVPAENIVLKMAGEGADRLLCACFHPFPAEGKPKKVLIEAWKISAYLVLDGVSGEVLEATPEAKGLFGNTPCLPIQSPLLSGLQMAVRDGSHYLGQFQHQQPDGREVQLEAILALVEDTELN